MSGTKASGSSPAQIVTACVAALVAFYFFRGVLAPFLLAAIIAIVVDAIAERIHRLLPPVPHWAAVLLLGAIAGALVVVGFGVFLHDAAGLAPQTDSIVERLQDALQAVASSFGFANVPDLRSLFAAADVNDSIHSMVASLTDALSTVGLIVLFLAFLLVSRGALDLKIAILGATEIRIQRMHALLELMAHGVRTVVLLQAVGAGLIGIASGIVVAIVGLHDALFWTIAIFLVSYLPVVGGMLAGIVPALFALGQFPTAWPAVIIFAAIQVINFIIGNVLMPRLQATGGPNVDPTAGILMFCLLSALWGIPGAILASPFTVMLMLVLAHFDASRWLAVLISNDGRPANATQAPAGETDASRIEP